MSVKASDQDQTVRDTTSTSGDPRPPARLRRRFGAPFFYTFVVCMVTWVVLSGKFDMFHLSLGVICSAIVGYASGDLMLPSRRVRGLGGRMWGVIRYLPWLLYQVWIANLHVLKLVFHPRMKDLIDPRIVRFRSQIDDEMGRFTFANSITLTPGTITIFVSILGNFTVHAIDKASAEGLPGEMEKRVARIFEDEDNE